MDGLKRLIRDEPVILVGLIQSLIGLGTAFGLGWTAEQVAIVLAFTQTLLSVIARLLVTPTANIDDTVPMEPHTHWQAPPVPPAPPMTAGQQAIRDVQQRAQRDRP